jgi:diketogulonate reductase-like aldo/keto reductase
VKREELFIATKLWVTDRSDPEDAIKKQLTAFSLEYFDLYLEHMPLSILDFEGKVTKTPLHQLWPKMEKLVKQGLTKSIGVSNYHIQLLMELLSYCEIKPVCNQIEYHPYLTEVSLVDYCKANEIVVVGYNTLCRGTYMSFHTEKNKNLLEEPLVKKFSEKYGKSPGQVALNFCLAQDILVIPASSNSKRALENLQSLSFKLTTEEVAQLHELNENIRFNPTSQWDWSKGVNLFG